LRAGVVAHPDDPGALDTAMRELYARWKRGALSPVVGVRRRTLELFSRPKLASDLAGLLDEISERDA
jgi:hypothetical protein